MGFDLIILFKVSLIFNPEDHFFGYRKFDEISEQERSILFKRELFSIHRDGA